MQLQKVASTEVKMLKLILYAIFNVIYRCGSYTPFQCYVDRQHRRSSFDMPSSDMLCNLAHIKMLTQWTLLDLTRLLVI